MPTTPTNNGIPSESPADLAFNAGKIDEFVNSPEEAFSDRFGVARLTITGIQAEADGVIDGIKAEGDAAIIGIGFTPVDSFEAGATITSRNQSLHYLADNNYYRWNGTLPKVVAAASTPTSSGGVSASAWVNVTDNTLRSQLASTANGNGDELVAVKQPYAGSVYRTQHDKNSEYINVLDFGAKGDGVTDDSSAFQLAVDAAVGTILSNNYNSSSITYGISYPVSVQIHVPVGDYVINILIDARNKDIIWNVDPGAKINSINNLQGRIVRNGHHETANTYGFSDYAGVYNIQANRDDYDDNNGTFGIVNPKDLSSYTSRDNSAINFWSQPHKFNALVNGCTTNATKLFPSSTLTSATLKQLREGMVIDLFVPSNYVNGDKYSGVIVGWTSTEIEVTGWVKMGSTTYVTPDPSFSTAIINPCTTTIGVMGYTYLPAGTENSKWAFVTEFDLINNLSDSPEPTYNGSYTLDQVKAHGIHVNSLGTKLGTSGVNVEGGFRAGYTASQVATGYWYQGTGVALRATNCDIAVQNSSTVSGKATTLSRKSLKFNVDQGVVASPVEISGNTTGGSEASSFAITMSGGAPGVEYSALISLFGTTATRQIMPQASNTYLCGTSTNYWSGGYTQTAFTVISDERTKHAKSSVPEEILEAWSDVEWCTFIYNNDPSNTVHAGAFAQQILKVIGDDALKYGLINYDKEVDIYGLRYEECLVVEAAYQRRRSDKLEERIGRLESMINSLAQ